MSTLRFSATVDDCMPALEVLEPRLLLSGAYATISPVTPLPYQHDLPKWVDFVPVERYHHPIIRDNLLDIAAEIADRKAADANADVSDLSSPGFRRVTPDGNIMVAIRFQSDQTYAPAALASLGFSADAYSQFKNNTTGFGWASYADLEALAGVTGVLEITMPLAGVTKAVTKYVQPVTSAGDGILNADALRSLAGVDGTGVKIGVISDGATNWDEIADLHELPATITIDQVRPGSGDEGTAMMEIIHDLAPGAELYFSSGLASSVDMVDSIDWLVGQGCDVIVDDLGFYGQPMFEDGTVAEAALDAIGDGVVYVSAAGNDGETHYQADFDAAQDNTHLFAQSQNMLLFSLPGGSVEMGYSSATGILQWSDEWGASANNYNLYLLEWMYDPGLEDWVWDGIDVSASIQNGDDNPFEAIQVTNDTASTVYYAWLIHKAGGSDRELELYTVGNATMYDSQLVVPGDSVFGHPAANGVIAVGAIAANDSGHDDIEPFSSQGASTIYTDFSNQTSTVRESLDVAGIDGVSTKAGIEGYFKYEPFYGTSAAAPHVAAIAALLLEIDPSLTPTDVVDLINDNAVDLGDAGYDDVFGSGRVDALATISAATGTPNLDDDSDTGVYYDDEITKLDNSDNDNKLDFTVTGTISGATVRLYAGETEIGSAVATGSTTPIETNGTVDLSDDQEPYSVHTITARQTVPDKLPSVASSGLEITVDVVAPTVTAFARYYDDGDWELRPTTLDTITITFSEDVYDEYSDSLSLYNLSTSQSLSPGYTFSGQETDEFTWDFDANLTSNPGWYSVTISGDVTDLAGNSLDGDGDGTGGDDYVYGASLPEKKMLIPILGDADLDGAVDWDDLQLVGGNFGGPDRTWSDGDFNYDGWVDSYDYITVKQHMGQSLSR